MLCVSGVVKISRRRGEPAAAKVTLKKHNKQWQESLFAVLLFYGNYYVNIKQHS